MPDHPLKLLRLSKKLSLGEVEKRSRRFVAQTGNKDYLVNAMLLSQIEHGATTTAAKIECLARVYRVPVKRIVTALVDWKGETNART